MNFNDYKKTLQADIAECLSEMQVQPIVFVGSGLSIRHWKGPTWHGLLEAVADLCPTTKGKYESIRGQFGDPIDCAEHLAEQYASWARSDGRSAFPKEVHEFAESAEQPAARQVFLKHRISAHLTDLTPPSPTGPTVLRKSELAALKEMSPHTIVTTNYDTFAQSVFDDYAPVVGDQMLRGKALSIGEVFHIHGSVGDAASLVVTRQDFERFKRRRKYLVAKLLTFFVEHPLLFVGYSCNDPNIRDVLHDVGELEHTRGRVIPNIYVVDWSDKVPTGDALQSEVSIEVETHRTIRVKRICTSELDWVYRAFASRAPIGTFRVKPLRALLARVNTLVRKDAASRAIEIDFSTLEGLIHDDSKLDHILGITQVGDGRDFNLQYRHTLTEVGLELGLGNWHGAKRLLERVRSEKCVDIQASDNRYHQAVKIGRAKHSLTHKYSDALIALLRRVQQGQDYEVELSPAPTGR